MTFPRFSAIVSAIVLTSSVAMARAQAPATVTGSWEGTFTFMKDGQVVDTDPVYLMLKQEGTTVTGSGGPNAERQFPIAKVKFASTKDATTLAFEVTAGELVINFDLKLTDGMLKGTANGEKGGEKQTAIVEVRPAK